MKPRKIVTRCVIDGRTAIAVAIKREHVIGLGIAIQNPDDKWNEELGKSIAEGRAIKRAEKLLVSPYLVSNRLKAYSEAMYIAYGIGSGYLLSNNVLSYILNEFVENRKKYLPAEVALPKISEIRINDVPNQSNEVEVAIPLNDHPIAYELPSGTNS